MKVVVIGGTGFLGSRAVRALERVSGLEVVSASRRGPVRVDLADPATFGALDGAGVVVDLADATSTPPDALARHCLERGIVFLETTSDMPAVERLAGLRGASGPGAVVLGAGIFTGLSNLMAKAVARPGGKLRLGIRSSPYSGAGRGTVALMISALATNAVSLCGGQRVEHPPISAGPRIDFPSGSHPTLRMPLAEEVMLPLSTGAADVDAFFSPKPSFLAYAFRSMPVFLLRMGWFRSVMAAYFGLLRRFLLASRTSTTEIVAEGDRGRCTLAAADGMTAGGVAIAAIVAAIARANARPTGCKMIDEVVELDAVVEEMGAIAPGSVTIERS